MNKIKKKWEYKWKCPTCGTEIPIEGLNREYLNNTYCTVCVLELKRKIDSGEINSMDEIRKKYGEGE
jgi:rRNA maturation endonuclease Nob1